MPADHPLEMFSTNGLSHIHVLIGANGHITTRIEVDGALGEHTPMALFNLVLPELNNGSFTALWASVWW